MAAPTTMPGKLSALLILHKVLLAGQVLFAAVAFYLVYTNSITESLQHLDRVLQVIAIAFSAGGFYTGTLLFKRKILQAREMRADAKEKFSLYRKACILQWSLIEGPCLFVITCFLLTGNYAFLVLAAVLLLLFVMMAPSKLKIIVQIQISEEETREL